MSNAISALNGATFDGFVTVQEAGLRGMITLRGDLGDKAFVTAVEKATGVKMPATNCITHAKDKAISWMSPDELLVTCGYGDVAALCAKLSKALSKLHHLCVDVSDARAVFRLSGENAREIVAKLAPVDIATMAAGDMRRTRFAQVAAAFWILDDTTIEIVTFRSTARYMFDLLCNAAKPGSEVGFR